MSSRAARVAAFESRCQRGTDVVRALCTRCANAVKTPPQPSPPTPPPLRKAEGWGGGLQDKCVGNLQVCLNSHYSSLGGALRGSAAARLSRAIRREARWGGWVSGGGGWGGQLKRKTTRKTISTELNWFRWLECENVTWQCNTLA